MSRKLKYKIISCSSEQSQYPVSSLIIGGQNGGWQTKRFCTYPQEVTFQFYGPVKIEKIQIISDSRKIPSQVDILYFLPFGPSGRQNEERFQKYGYLNFSRNENSQYRQQKSIMVDIKCLYLRFLFHKPHHTKENFFSQVGIQQITIFGTDSNTSFAPIQKLPRQIGYQSHNNQIVDEDPFIYEKVSYLTTMKQKAVERQDFEEANDYKIMIEQVRKLGQELKKLQAQKQMAIQEQNYQKANNLKKSIQKHKQQIDNLIAFQDQDNQNNNGQQEFNDNYDGQDMINNDFQDNQFVDPEMNEMIKKSGTFSKINNNNLGQSKIGNSRVKLNRSNLHKKTHFQNYDDKVIPTLAGGKVKTQQSQVLQKEEEKKVQFQPQQIDGKYIQFATIMQQHFSQEIVKCFFSRHWQLKVQALTNIQEQIKKKANADQNFIKCLIVVCKNSISQKNFQVALNSLQIVRDMLKINQKENILPRSNQLSNDLDVIIKEILKKMSDNNNKIKQEADRVFGDMVNSSLYGPEICAVALTKSKQKIKLSTKQLLSRLVQLTKIVQNYANSPNILQIAIDYGIQQSKNPAIEVRNESVNLLSVCQSQNPQMTDKKLADKPNILGLLQNYSQKLNNNSKVKTKKKK